MRKRVLRHTALLLLLVLCLSWGARPAFASSEQAEVAIPVSAVGADCTPAIYDKDGNEVQRAAVKDGESKNLTLTCTGVGSHPYTVKLTDEDTDTTTYDKTAYTVHVTLYYTRSGSIGHVITANRVDTPGNSFKPEKLEFLNLPSVSPTPDPKPDPTPSPSPTPSTTPLPCTVDPPVQKKIQGNPASKGTFVFVLTAANARCPMPAGNTGGVKELTIIGEGTSEFGDISLTEAGTYEYTVTEKDTGEAGYTYDASVYIIRYLVTNVDGQLVAARTIFKDGKVVDGIASAVFTNVYQAEATPKDEALRKVRTLSTREATPQTGDSSSVGLHGAAMALSFGLLLLLLAELLRNPREDELER